MRPTPLLILAISSLAVSAADFIPLKLIQTIPLPGVQGRFDHFSIDSKGNRLFIAALGNNTLEIIDLSAGKRIQSVAGMSKPTGVLYLADQNRVVVANGDDGTLKLLDATTFKPIQTLAKVPDADNLRLDSQTKLAWLGYGDGALAPIDTEGLKVVARVKLGGHPESFQLEKQGTRIFVNVPDAKEIAVIDRKNRSLVQTWTMEHFQANFPMALDEPNHRLFVGCRNPPRLVVLDTQVGKSMADVPIAGDTDDLFYDAKRKRLYLSCGEGFIDVIEQPSPDKFQRVTQIPSSPGARTSFFSPDLDRYFVAVPDRHNKTAELRVYQPQ
jgi:hypothetical protein